MPRERFDLQTVYDTEVQPLVQQVIELGKGFDMPMLMAFQYNQSSVELVTHFPPLRTDEGLILGCKVIKMSA